MAADATDLLTHDTDVLTELLREAFGWDEVTVNPGPRGATLASTRPLATLIDGAIAYQVPGFDPDR